jgi:hypothetical protein
MERGYASPSTAFGVQRLVTRKSTPLDRLSVTVGTVAQARECRWTVLCKVARAVAWIATALRYHVMCWPRLATPSRLPYDRLPSPPLMIFRSRMASRRDSECPRLGARRSLSMATRASLLRGGRRRVMLHPIPGILLGAGAVAVMLEHRVIYVSTYSVLQNSRE